MGGTDVSRMPGGSVTVGPSSFCFCRVFFDGRPPGRGEDTRGVGGFVAALGWSILVALFAAADSGTGGVGRAATLDASWGCFSVLAVLSSLGLACRLATELARVVGDEVWFLGYVGRPCCFARWARLLTAPGEGSGGTCPVLSTDMALSCAAWLFLLSWLWLSCEVFVRSGDG